MTGGKDWVYRTFLSCPTGGLVIVVDWGKGKGNGTATGFSIEDSKDDVRGLS